MAARLKELILGGDGLIGSALTSALRARGHQVVSMDLRTGVDLREVTIEPFAECDRVWFLAWDTGGAKYLSSDVHQREMYRNNCLICARVFDHLGATKRPFVFTTSQLAGRPHAYGVTKLLGETWARQLGGRIARLWNVYGWEPPGVRSHVVPDLVLAGLRQRRIELRTNGRERRRLLYKTDCAEALVALFDGDQPEAEIAGDRWITVGDLANTVAVATGADLVVGEADGEEVLWDPTKPPRGWRPTVGLDEGIARVIADARSYLQG